MFVRLSIVSNIRNESFYCYATRTVLSVIMNGFLSFLEMLVQTINGRPIILALKFTYNSIPTL